jgi:cobalt-zinc-cadmium resistance protein CzcA
VDKAEIARRGLSLAAVQEVIGAATAPMRASFEGDRYFEIVVRLLSDPHTSMR